MKILDCSFRDGGYYTSWNFSKELVDQYLAALVSAKVDYIELGYRSIVNNDKYGQQKYVTDDYLDSLPEIGETKLAIMVDVKEFAVKEDLAEAVEQNFKAKTDSRLSMVRLAITDDVFDLSLKLGKLLKDKGYEVTINYMQFMLLSDTDFKQALDKMREADLKIIYFADSYGSMMAKDVDHIFTIMKDYPDFQVGVHFHNNIDMAFANTVKSLEYEPDFIDGTILGMGRGAGNLKIENLLYFFNQEQISIHDPKPVFKLAGDYFLPLKEEYNWGPNLAYTLAGFNNIHQTYVFNLLKTKRYSLTEIVNMVNYISQDSRANRFSEELEREAITHRFESEAKLIAFESQTIGNFKEDLSTQSVLIIGRGPSSTEHSEEINKYITQQQPVVYECNSLPQIDANKGKHYCLSIKYNSFKDSLKYLQERDKQAVIGFPKVEEDMISDVNELKPVYLPYKVTEGELEKDLETGLIIPADVVSMYAIMLAVGQGAKKIYLSGFDGYTDLNNPENQRMQTEMEEFIKLLQTKYPEVSLISLTPTTYGLSEELIF